MEKQKDIIDLINVVEKKQFGKTKPIRNEPRPQVSEEEFRWNLDYKKEETILGFAKYLTGKRKKSTQNRLGKLSEAELVEMAVVSNYIENEGEPTKPRHKKNNTYRNKLKKLGKIRKGKAGEPS